MRTIFWAWSMSKADNSTKPADSFEEAVRLMPHESVNHSNLGFSLAVAGDWNSAEQEARTAIQLDPANTRAKTLLELIRGRKTKKRSPN